MLSKSELLSEKQGGSSLSFMKRVLRYMDGCDLLVDFDGKKEDVVVVDDFYQTRTTMHLCRFSHDEVVRGSILLNPQGRSYSHLGIQIELRGVLGVQHSYEDIAMSEGGSSSTGVHGTSMIESSSTFLCQAKTYEPGTIEQPTRFPFQFGGPKPFESYYGNRVQVRYMIYVRINRSLKNISHREHFFVTRVTEPSAAPIKRTNAVAVAEAKEPEKEEEASAASPSEELFPAATAKTDVTEDDTERDASRSGVLGSFSVPTESVAYAHLQALFLSHVNPPPTSLARVSEIGVQDRLQLSFSFSPSASHLDGLILGQVRFLRVGCEVLSGEISLVRQEYVASIGLFDEEMDSAIRATATGSLHSETLQAFEILDGTPRAGDVVPIRILLGSVPRVTPTYGNLHGSRARVRYFLNLSLVTGEGKRYFKKEEIHLFRRMDQMRLTRPTLLSA